MSSKKNLPATQESKNVALSSYEADAGAGFEDISQEDLAIPFINILQKMSPAVDEDSPFYINGAKAGKLVNSVTNQVYDGKEGIRFVPVHREHSFVEWRNREQGGGFVAKHEPESEVVRRARAAAGGQWGKLNHQGNDLIETFSVYGVVITPDESYDTAVINFSSSNIKQYKRWMTTARSIQIRTDDGRRITPPLFSHVYRIKTQYQENAKGSWYSFLVNLDAPTAEMCRLEEDHELYVFAKQFRDLVTSGAAQAQYNEPKAEAKEEGEDTF